MLKPKLKAALKTLKWLGHKYYQFVRDKDLEDYDNRCKETDIDGFNFLNGISNEDSTEKNKTIGSTAENNEEESDEDDKENEKILTKDPVAKFQFDYNRNTCFSNDVPELVIDESAINQKISIAPGEGKIPTNILEDDDILTLIQQERTA